MGTVSQCSKISETSRRYRTSQMLHSPTATGANSLDGDGHAGTRVDATTERDWVATTQSSQVPFTSPMTESCDRASNRLARYAVG